MKNLITILLFVMSSTNAFAGSFNCVDTIKQKVEFKLECKSRRSCDVVIKRNLNITKQELSIPLGSKLKAKVKKSRVGDKSLYLNVDLSRAANSKKWTRPHFRLDSIPSDLKSTFSGKLILRAYNSAQKGSAKDLLKTTMGCRAI